MPLVVSVLASSLALAFVADGKKSPAAVAKKVADAYGSYAAAAIALTAVPCALVAPGNADAMVPAIAAALVPGPAGRFEAALMGAVPAFWATSKFVGPPIPPATAPTASVSVVFPGIGVLLGVLSLPMPSAAAATGALAAALHAATISGVVTFASAPPGSIV